MEKQPCPHCGAANLKTDLQCLSCGASLVQRPTASAPSVAVPAVEEAAPTSYWDTPQGQRRIALISGSVLLVGIAVLLQGLLGALIIPIVITAGIWELIQWSREREQAKHFARAKDKESLQAELARYDRPDRYVQTRSGVMHVQGFDSRLDAGDKKE